MMDDLLGTAVGAVLASLLAWIVGTRVAYRWDDLKRRRESDLADRAEFYRIYGEFFAVWKLWDTHVTRPGLEVPSGVQWELLNRGGHMEGGFEALLVKVASERRLSDREVTLLAIHALSVAIVVVRRVRLHLSRLAIGSWDSRQLDHFRPEAPRLCLLDQLLDVAQPLTPVLTLCKNN